LLFPVLRDIIPVAGLQLIALESCSCALLGMLRPGSTPAPQPPSTRRNDPAGLITCTSLFLALSSSPSRLPSASRTGELCRPLRGMPLLPGSTPAPQPPSRNVPAGLNTYTSLFFHTEIVSESLAFCLSHWRLYMLTLRDAVAGLNSGAAASLEECSGSTPAPHSSSHRDSSPSRRPRLHWRTVLDHYEGNCGRAQLWHCSLPRGMIRPG
jgi:hypothetical protein